MPTVEDIRHQNLLLLIEEAGCIQALATKVDRSHSQISQLKNRSKHSKSGAPRVIGGDVARHIESKRELPAGWMDTPHTRQELLDLRRSPQASMVVTPPPPPPSTFEDRKVVSDTDWDLLLDVKMLPPSELATIRARAEEIRAHYKRWEAAVMGEKK